MSACRRGCQTNVVALALYRSECQFRRLAPLHWLVKQGTGLILATRANSRTRPEANRHGPLRTSLEVPRSKGAAGYAVDMTVSMTCCRC
jgi:hypothetical protein